MLIVLDQFEQFLHSTPDDEQEGLVETLRECDGQRLQCVVMVRDDFLTPVNRFMKRLQIPLSESRNYALVDLFDKWHAKKVLALLGQAYGALPKSGNLTREQDTFLNRAISGLAEGDRVICVRLALFAEMVKTKEWTPATLKAVGGAEGVGVAFLEDSFAAPTAPARKSPSSECRTKGPGRSAAGIGHKYPRGNADEARASGQIRISSPLRPTSRNCWAFSTTSCVL